MMQPGMTPAERVSARDAEPIAAIRAEFRQRLGIARYEMWCDGKISWALQGERLTIGVASPFLLNWMQKQFRAHLIEAAQTALGPAAQVVFEVDGRISLSGAAAASAAKEPKLAVETPALSGALVVQASAGKTAHGGGAKDGVVPVRAEAGALPRTRRLADLTEFVAGAANQMALAAARQIADGLPTMFNPLYLYGGVGTGKSHLLEGVCRRLRTRHMAQNIVLTNAEAFANYFTQALRDRTLPGFRQKFRSADVLLMDDIEFFEGKQVIQEEFLHTLMDLMDHGRRVVLTGDRHPRLLTRLSDAVTTRIMAGMVCRLDTPDLETRRRIVAAKAVRHAIPFPGDVLDYIAQRFQTSVRELEGALHCLTTYGEMTKQPLTIGIARDVLSDLEQDCRKIIRLADIEQAVCNFFGLTERELKSERRSRSVSQPRMLAMYLARKHTSSAYSEIGRHFGGRNHSTVMSAERKVTEWLQDNASVKVAVQKWSIHDVVGTLEQQLLAG